MRSVYAKSPEAVRRAEVAPVADQGGGGEDAFPEVDLMEDGGFDPAGLHHREFARERGEEGPAAVHHRVKGRRYFWPRR
jgi:hypothetical protein